MPRSIDVGGPAFMRKDLLLEADSSKCLAREADSLPCLLDAAGFNRRVLTRQMFEGRDLDFIRARILREALEAAFWARKGREAGIRESAGVEEELGEYLRFFRRTESRRILKRKVFPPENLRALYDRHYETSFRAARDLCVRLLGSTDRDALERLRRTLAAPAGGRRVPASAGARPPWVEWKASELPEEIAAATDTLKTGGHVLVSLPYGHFLVVVDSAVVLPEIPFEEAQGALRELAMREDWDLEYRAHIYWQNNRREFLTPDTLQLAAWINPEIAPPGGRRSVPREELSAQPHLVLPHTALPELVRSALPESLAVGAFAGPLATPFGEWHFRALSRKPGGRLRPFREVRESVKERVLYPPVGLYDSLEKDLRIVKSENYRAIAVQQAFIEAGDPSGSGGIPSFAAMQAEKETWLRSLEVDGFPMWPLPPPGDAPGTAQADGGEDSGGRAAPVK